MSEGGARGSVKLRRTALAAILLALIGVSGPGCGANSTKKQYVLAEKLWTDGKYAAAVTEFDKVAAKDPQGKLGLQALYRSASTQALFLSEYTDAVRKFRLYAQMSGDTPLAWQARKQAADILYSRLEQYDPAIQQYRAMLIQKPRDPEAPEFKFRIAKSLFFLWRFGDAVAQYREIIRDYPRSTWAEQAAFEIGQTYYTQGERQGSGPGATAPSSPPGPGAKSARATTSYTDAMAAFEDFIRVYPRSTRVPEAKFGIASCLEEMDQLDAAYQAYRDLLPTYPSPKVIQIKMVRIRERKGQRSR